MCPALSDQEKSSLDLMGSPNREMDYVRYSRCGQRRSLNEQLQVAPAVVDCGELTHLVSYSRQPYFKLKLHSFRLPLVPFVAIWRPSERKSVYSGDPNMQKEHTRRGFSIYVSSSFLLPWATTDMLSDLY